MDYKDRIKQRLNDLNIKAKPASIAAGLNGTYVRDLLDGKVKTVRLDKITKLATSLKCSPAWLVFGVGDVDDPLPETSLSSELNQEYVGYCLRHFSSIIAETYKQESSIEELIGQDSNKPLSDDPMRQYWLDRASDFKKGLAFLEKTSGNYQDLPVVIELS